jgi:hypothetical protein
MSGFDFHWSPPSLSRSCTWHLPTQSANDAIVVSFNRVYML